MKHTLQGADVRRWREEAGLTQQQAAERLGIAREWLSRVETGAAPVSAALFLKLQRELQITSPDIVALDSKGNLLVAEAKAPPDPADELRRKCVTHFHDFLAATGSNLERLGWVWVELQERFPLHKWKRGGSTTELHQSILREVLDEEQGAKEGKDHSSGGKAEGKAG